MIGAMTVITSGRLTWLADAARASGLKVVETDGWQTRGHGTAGLPPGLSDFIEARGVMCHHTAGAAQGDMPSLSTLIAGRSDLSGPLCNLALSRNGTVYVVAAGVAWHAGTGVWSSWLPRDMGNWYAIGIEAESVGTRDDWTPAQRDAYPRICAALCAALGVGADRVVAHKEYDPLEKIDPAYWNMSDMRSSVASLISKVDTMDTAAPIPFPATARQYFEKLAPGLGDDIAANFPLGGTAPWGAADAYGEMSARAGVLVGVRNMHAIAALSAGLATMDTALGTMAAQLTAARQDIQTLTALVRAQHAETPAT